MTNPNQQQLSPMDLAAECERYANGLATPNTAITRWLTVDELRRIAALLRAGEQMRAVLEAVEWSCYGNCPVCGSHGLDEGHADGCALWAAMRAVRAVQ